jgi:hypothetical protein
MHNGEFYSYNQAFEYYQGLGYKDYGWVNGGAKPPKIPFKTAYQNYSGSSTLMVNEEFGCMYSVDMGD